MNIKMLLNIIMTLSSCSTLPSTYTSTPLLMMEVIKYMNGSKDVKHISQATFNGMKHPPYREDLIIDFISAAMSGPRNEKEQSAQLLNKNLSGPANEAKTYIINEAIRKYSAQRKLGFKTVISEAIKYLQEDASIFTLLFFDFALEEQKIKLNSNSIGAERLIIVIKLAHQHNETDIMHKTFSILMNDLNNQISPHYPLKHDDIIFLLQAGLETAQDEIVKKIIEKSFELEYIPLALDILITAFKSEKIEMIKIAFNNALKLILKDGKVDQYTITIILAAHKLKHHKAIKILNDFVLEKAKNVQEYIMLRQTYKTLENQELENLSLQKAREIASSTYDYLALAHMHHELEEQEDSITMMKKALEIAKPIELGWLQDHRSIIEQARKLKQAEIIDLAFNQLIEKSKNFEDSHRILSMAIILYRQNSNEIESDSSESEDDMIHDNKIKKALQNALNKISQSYDDFEKYLTLIREFHHADPQEFRNIILEHALNRINNFDQWLSAMHTIHKMEIEDQALIKQVLKAGIAKAENAYQYQQLEGKASITEQEDMIDEIISSALEKELTSTDYMQIAKLAKKYNLPHFIELAMEKAMSLTDDCSVHDLIEIGTASNEFHMLEMAKNTLEKSVKLAITLYDWKNIKTAAQDLNANGIDANDILRIANEHIDNRQREDSDSMIAHQD